MRAPPSCPVCEGEGTSPHPDYAHPLFRCAECGFVFIPPEQLRPLEELYDEQYYASRYGDPRAEENLQRISFAARRRLDWLARFRSPPAQLLEIGSAEGILLSEARARGYTVSGLEPMQAQAAYARETFALEIQAVSLEEAELPEQLELILAYHVLEHLPQPTLALQKLRAHLREDGLIVLEVPNIESARARRQKDAWWGFDYPYHVGHFSARSLTRCLHEAGFEPLVVESVQASHYLAGRIMGPATAVMEVLRGGQPLPPWRAHPSGHQFLRALARPSRSPAGHPDRRQRDTSGREGAGLASRG